MRVAKLAINLPYSSLATPEKNAVYVGGYSGLVDDSYLTWKRRDAILIY